MRLDAVPDGAVGDWGKPDSQRIGMLTDARLSEPPTARMIRLGVGPGLVRELRMFDHFFKVDMAHTVMLVERKILSRGDGQKILRLLREMAALGVERFPIDASKGSFLLQVEDFLFGRI